LLGLVPGLPAQTQVGRMLAENGFEIVLPATVSREKLRTEDKQLMASDQTHREWIYRQAYHMGRHVIGYEVQMAMAAVDWFRQKHGEQIKVGIGGYGEGALVAFYTAAIDPRIDAALISGYFDSRQKVWSEPIYRNVWGLLQEFGDAEIASLILPRTLILEHTQTPLVENQKGEWHTPEFASVKREAERIECGPFAKPQLFEAKAGPFAGESVRAFARALGREQLSSTRNETPQDRRRAFEPAVREQQLLNQMERFTQRLVRESAKVRNNSFIYSIVPELAEGQWSTARRHPTRSPTRAGARRTGGRRLQCSASVARRGHPQAPDSTGERARAIGPCA